MQAIIDLFQQNHIKYIVSVDDCYQEEVTEEMKVELASDIALEFELYEKVLKEFCEQSVLQGIQRLHSDEMKEARFKTLILELENSQIRKLLEVYGDQSNVEREHLTAFLNKLVKIGAVDSYETFGDIETAEKFLKEEIQNKWGPSEQEKVLWLIDREFGVDHRRNEGFKLLEHFCSKDNNWNIGILATRKTDDITGHSQFDEFLEKNSVSLRENKNSVWFISKELIDEKQDRKFAKSILHGLRRNQTYKITNYLVQELRGGIEVAAKEFTNIKQPTINNIILNFSTKEGTSIIETLLRILLAITKYDLNKKIGESYEDISKMIYEYEKLSNDIKGEKIENLSEVYELRRKEKYNDHVNGHYHPIGFGDIFKINNEAYVLVSQPCDITIRGDNGQRNLQKATLLKLTEEKPTHEAYAILNYYERTKEYYVLFRDVLMLDFNILDLCSLNDDGKSKVSIEYMENGFKGLHKFSTGQRKRLEEVRSNINEIYTQKKNVEKSMYELELAITSENISKKDQILSIIADYKKTEKEFWKESNSTNNFIIEEGHLVYDVRRVSRLDELTTTSIMMEYSIYNSRLGLPGDFAAEFRHTLYKLQVKNPHYYFGDNGDEKLIINSEYIILESENKEENIKNKVCNEFVGEKNSRAEEFKKDFIMVEKKEQEIVLLPDIFMVEGREYIDFKKEVIKIPFEKDFKAFCPGFYQLIKELEEQSALIARSKLWRFYKNGKQINPEITFKFREFIEGKVSIELSSHEVVQIRYNIDEPSKSNYNFSIEMREDKEAIDEVKKILFAHK